MLIKYWFYEKSFTKTEKAAIEDGSSFLNWGDWEVVKETDKAISLKITTDYGKIFKWIPKSVLTKQVKVGDKGEN